MKDVVKGKKHGKCIIPFSCSLKAAKIEIPDYVAQQNLLDNQRAPVDIVLAIDISGSMAGSKLKILVSAVKLIMDCLSEQDRLGVVTFESVGKRLTRLLRLTPKNKTMISTKLDQMKAKGGTNIAEAMDISMAMLG